MRLDRFLANLAYGSRSEVKQMIRAGQIAVNALVVRDDAFQIDPCEDLISCRGETVRFREHLYLVMNKPGGIITATEDRSARTVLDLIDPKYRTKGIYPVGRLDKDTEGLLILTNDGALGHRLLAPKNHIPKQYFARLDAPVEDGDVRAFGEGIRLEEDFTTLPAELEVCDADPCEAMVTIHEGKFHQVKRMFEARGKKVVYLKRIVMGALRLDPALQPGEWRELTDAELRLLENS